MTAVTPPGVARTWDTQLRLLDHVHAPESWLMREDGSQICWGDVVKTSIWCSHYGPAEVWNQQALQCPCDCHREEPTGGRPGPAPAQEPEPRGPDTWPDPRDIPPPPPPRPIPDGRQLGLYDPPWSAP